MISRIGYTTKAIAGNGIPNICDAVLLNTLLHERVLLISQNAGPLISEYAIWVRYPALMIAIRQRIITARSFLFMVYDMVMNKILLSV